MRGMKICARRQKNEDLVLLTNKKIVLLELEVFQDGWVYRLSASLDKAINISMGQSSSKVQHVYKVMTIMLREVLIIFFCFSQAVKVSGIPMYGYHPRQHTFVKVNAI